jgi:hypothetical protein
MTPIELLDVQAEFQDLQREVSVNLLNWLANKTEPAMQRLTASREREAAFLKFITTPEQPWLAEGITRRQWYERRRAMQPQDGIELEECSMPERTEVLRWQDK